MNFSSEILNAKSTFTISNQSGIHKGVISEEDCMACMERTKEMLDFTTLPISNPTKSAEMSAKATLPRAFSMRKGVKISK